MKKMIVLILTGLLLGGCIGLPINSNQSTLSIPKGEVIVDNKRYEMKVGDAQWKEGNIEAEKTSTLSINELAEVFDTLELEKGQDIEFEIDKNPTSIEVYAWKENGIIEQVETEEYKLTLPINEGYFIYEVIVKSNQGEITYVFDVNVND